MLGAFESARRSIVVTQFVTVSGVNLVKRGDVLGGSVAKDTIEHSKRLVRVSDPYLCHSFDFGVRTHGESSIPRVPRTYAGALSPGAMPPGWRPTPRQRLVERRVGELRLLLGPVGHERPCPGPRPDGCSRGNDPRRRRGDG